MSPTFSTVMPWVIMACCLSCFSLAADVSTLFQDDFQPCYYSGCTNGLNNENWGYDLGDASDWGAQGWGNQELQCYSSEAKAVSVTKKGGTPGDGVLTIQATKTPGADCRNAKQTTKRDYTSARIVTRNKRSFRWSGNKQRSDTIFVEARMKLPAGKGVWPAFWMLPEADCRDTGPGCGQYGRWCQSGEIDIMEGINDMNRVYGTVVDPQDGSSNEERCQRVQGSRRRKKGSSFAQSYHTFGFSWNATHMNWYINNSRYHHVNYSEWNEFNPSRPPSSPYDQPFYLVLNLAVGGNWPGNPERDDAFPAKMMVDWVRVRRLSCSPQDVNETNCNNGIDDDCDGLIDGEDKDCGWGQRAGVMLPLVLLAALVAIFAV